MNLDDKTLLRGWINHLSWDCLDALRPDGTESAKKRVASLLQSLASKARFYQKMDWAEFWQAGRQATPAWEATALQQFATLMNLPEPVADLQHAVRQWFAPNIGELLPQEIVTLADLMDRLDNQATGRQPLPVSLTPSLKLLRRFFAEHAESLGRTLHPSAPVVRNALPQLQPLTMLPAPSSQSTPLNESIIAAANDVEAAATWLKAKGGRSAHTFDVYRREATRFLLWLGEKQLTLAELKVNHIESYYAHLENPPAHWLRPRKPKRNQPLQPSQVLTGPLSPSSIDQSRTILSQLCGYLQQAGYLRHNVFRLTSRPVIIKQTIVTRLLDLDGWHWLWAWILALPASTERERLLAVRTRWLFALLYHTGLRRSEAANGKMGDFVRKDQAWTLRVIGKGNKEKYVTVNSALLRELRQYRTAIGLRDIPSPAETTPLVGSVQSTRHNTPMTPRAIGKIIYDVGDRAGAECPDDQIRAQIENMTTHWLRHTNATHRLMAGASLETTQDELGHADPRTTRIYAKTTDRRKQEDAEKLVNLKAGDY